MAFTNSSDSFSLLFVATVTILVLVSQSASAQPGGPINPFCNTASHKKLCTKMVNGATSKEEATANAIKAALDAAKKIQTLTPLVVKATSDLDENMKSQLIDDCADSFSNTIDDLNLSLESLKQGDMGGAGTRLSAAFDGDCADSLKEEGVSLPALSKLNLYFGKVVDNALAVAFQD